VNTSAGTLSRTVSRDRELGALRHARGGELGAVEIAGDPLVLAEEESCLFISSEIEREIERAAQARILELVAPDVEREGLHDAVSCGPGIPPLMTRLSATAGKLYDVAQSLAEFSVRQSALSPLKASSATVLSRR
jgi:hypothetical protein